VSLSRRLALLDEAIAANDQLMGPESSSAEEFAAQTEIYLDFRNLSFCDRMVALS
jgi:hypothetical protein